MSDLKPGTAVRHIQTDEEMVITGPGYFSDEVAVTNSKGKAMYVDPFIVEPIEPKKDRSALAKESATAPTENPSEKDPVMNQLITDDCPPVQNHNTIGDPRWAAYAPGTRVYVVLASGELTRATVINISTITSLNPDMVSLHIDQTHDRIETHVHVSRICPVEELAAVEYADGHTDQVITNE